MVEIYLFWKGILTESSWQGGDSDRQNILCQNPLGQPSGASWGFPLKGALQLSAKIGLNCITIALGLKVDRGYK